MAKRGARRLVIHADVLHSAGESEHSISSACRTFLETVFDVGHYVVISDAIHEEWRRHSDSRITRIWRRRMYGRRLFIWIEGEEDKILQGRINAAVDSNHKAIVIKDVHLIEAAIATDRLVSSRDETARRAFKISSNDIKEIREIVWVNPTQADEKPIDWLRDGAKAEAHRQLGA